MIHSLKGHTIALLFGLLLAVGLSEAVARLLLPGDFGQPATLDERNQVFGHDGVLGWFPIPGSTASYTGERTIAVSHNSVGLRDRELGPKKLKRLLVIGDSFVWGYDAEADERFTDLMQEKKPQWRIINAGVSGYGTDQELLLLKRFGAAIQPDHVLLIFSDNDRLDNSANLGYGGYFKPYFAKVDGLLQVHGVPVPKSRNFAGDLGVLRPLMLARLLAFHGQKFDEQIIRVDDPTDELVLMIRDFVVNELRAQFSIGVNAKDPRLAALCTSTGTPCIDLHTWRRFPGHGGHWTPDGNKWVAERLLRRLSL